MSYYTAKPVYEVEIDALRDQIRSLGRAVEQHRIRSTLLEDAVRLIAKKTDLSCPTDRGEAIQTIYDVNLIASEALHNVEMLG